MARLLIPTRNRPTSLMSVIAFLERFHPGTRVIVADGSADAFAEENRAAMTAPERGGLVEYRRYPYEMGLFERILDVLGNIDDATLVMGSDDDYPFMDVLERAERRLMAKPEASTAMGAKLSFTLYGPGEATAGLVVARTIAGADLRARAASFARWPFSTTYAVTRREVLIERFERARAVFLTGLYDFGVGLYDVAHGEILALPEYCFAMTRNFTHSYLRPESDLTFVHRAGEVLTLRGFVVGDLVARGGLPRAEAEAFADEIFERKIVGGRFSSRRNFETSPLFLREQVQAQVRLFENTFRPGTAEHAAHRERLGFILDRLAATTSSRDNHGEDKEVATLDRQMTEGRDAGARAAVPGNPFTRYHGGRRYRDPVNLVRRIDLATLTWRDDPGARLEVLALGAGFGDAEDAAAVSLGAETPWPAVATRLAATSVWAALHVTTIGAAGDTIADWRPGGAAREALAARLADLEARETPPSLVLWHVPGGAADAAAYETAFDAVHEAVTAALPDARWIVLRTGAADAAERAAQEAIIERYGNTLAGSDMALVPAGDGAAFASQVFEAIREPARAWQRAQTALVMPVRPRSTRADGQGEGRAPDAPRRRRRRADAPPD